MEGCSMRRGIAQAMERLGNSIQEVSAVMHEEGTPTNRALLDVKTSFHNVTRISDFWKSEVRKAIKIQDVNEYIAEEITDLFLTKLFGSSSPLPSDIWKEEPLYLYNDAITQIRTTMNCNPAYAYEWIYRVNEACIEGGILRSRKLYNIIESVLSALFEYNCDKNPYYTNDRDTFFNLLK